MQCSRNVRTFEEHNTLPLTTEQRPSETSARFYYPIGMYSSPNNVRVIKSRRMRWAGHVARMGEERGGV